MKLSTCNILSRERSAKRWMFGLGVCVYNLLIFFSLNLKGVLGTLIGGYAYLKRRESSQNEPTVRADGAPKQTSTMMLEMGSKLLQSRAPTGESYLILYLALIYFTYDIRN